MFAGLTIGSSSMYQLLATVYEIDGHQYCRAELYHGDLSDGEILDSTQTSRDCSDDEFDASHYEILKLIASSCWRIAENSERSLF